MWLPRVVTVAPTTEPVTLAEAKAQCRVDDSNSDAYLTALISAARQHVEQVTGAAIVSQTLQLQCSDWSDLRAIPAAPLATISSVKYLDVTGVEITLSSNAYAFVGANTLQPSIEPAYSYSWPAALGQGDAIRVVAVAGYSTVPASLKAAILLLIGQWFEYREPIIEGTIAELPNAVQALLSNYRIYA